MSYIFIKKDQDWKILSLYNKTTLAYTPEPEKFNLQIFLPQRSLKLHLLSRKVFDKYLYIAWKHIL